MCAHWYPEGYVLPTSTAYPPGPHHPSYTPKVTSHHGAPKPWYAPHVQGSSQERSRPSPSPASRSSSSSHTNTSTDGFSASMPSHTMAGIGDPGLVSGVDYFKIGDTVRVRRLTSSNTYTDWAYGQVTRPHLKQYRVGITFSSNVREDHLQQPKFAYIELIVWLSQTTEPERVYYVSYIDPRNGERKESEFSCHRKEIASFYERRGGQSPLVFASIPSKTTSKGHVWIPAHVTNVSDSGVDVKVGATHVQHGSPTHFRGVQALVPYNSSVVRSLKAAGHKIMGDGH
ncbi:hypothetical protein EV359DRAFT_77932 [Lentinula novae-zelandiae]|nr:hypothetical protein EV359DRAFT_77932 [Lentinula novae-zelandiae]